MKKLLILASLFATLVASAQLKTNISLTWTYPGSIEGITFYIYGTSNVTLNITNWPVLYTASNTLSLVKPMQAPPSQWFYATKASNSWGLSSFTPVATLEAGPLATGTLSATPGP
jgi:hypothetical protein